MPMCGGISGELQAADPVVHEIIESVRSDLWTQILAQLQEAQENSALVGVGLEDESHITLEPLSYKTQLVAGTNYFVKVRVSHKSEVFGPKVFHARIYRSLNKSTELVRLTPWKEPEDPIEYF